jgi:hypothetical protein
MAYESLQAVVGAAIVDSGFRKALLNGSRRRVISSFNLSNDEVNAVMEIRADSLAQFAGQLDSWITRAQGRLDPPALTLPNARTRYA